MIRGSLLILERKVLIMALISSLEWSEDWEEVEEVPP
jgi:hypothetical protein